jgi:hypothetical protein
MSARAMRREPLSEEELEKRKMQYEEKVLFMPEADVVVNNLEGRIEEADRAFEAIIQGALASH